jgi:hypothetical protein
VSFSPVHVHPQNLPSLSPTFNIPPAKYVFTWFRHPYVKWFLKQSLKVPKREIFDGGFFA